MSSKMRDNKSESVAVAAAVVVNTCGAIGSVAVAVDAAGNIIGDVVVLVDVLSVFACKAGRMGDGVVVVVAGTRDCLVTCCFFCFFAVCVVPSVCFTYKTDLKKGYNDS